MCDVEVGISKLSVIQRIKEVTVKVDANKETSFHKPVLLFWFATQLDVLPFAWTINVWNERQISSGFTKEWHFIRIFT